jgi:hypothetical protein
MDHLKIEKVEETKLCVRLKKGEEQHHGSLEGSVTVETEQSCVILHHCD